MSQPPIYLDNAATSWPKPNSVYDAVDRYQRENGAPYGRGGYSAATTVGRTIESLRVELAELIGVGDSNRIIFTYSGTDSLNMAIHGVVRPGDHIVTTCAEHNSILRPLRFLEEISEGQVSVSRVAVDKDGIFSAEDVINAVRDDTRLIAITHASNVTGAIYPVETVGKFCKNGGPLFLLDAAQSLGHLPIDVEKLGCDFLAAPGHKGLLGPTGTGILYIGPDTSFSLQPYRQGGTGTVSESDLQPDDLPSRYESGNHNVPGLVGLAAGVSYVRKETIASLRNHELDLMSRLESDLREMPHVRCYGPPNANARVGVLSLNVNGMDPQELAAILDSSISVRCRSGLHCAPLIHNAIGTTELGGTLRLSVGPFTTNDHIDAVTQLLRQLG